MNMFRDGAFVLGIATLTALIVTPLVGPGMARAKDELPAIEVLKTPSTLEASGITLSLEFHKKAYGAGDKPVVRLTAVGGKEAAKAEATVRMHVTKPTSPMARMMPIPQEVFTKSVPISLKPGEKKTIELPTEYAVAAGTTSSFSIVVEDKHVAAGSFSIPGPKLELGLVLEPKNVRDAAILYLPKVEIQDAPSKAEILTR